MKTAITVLQEMMVKLQQTPDYECIAQSGPQHQAMFEYQCSALGAVTRAAARSKKEAKQEAARLMLRELAARGHAVPPPFGLAPPPPQPGAGAPSSSTALAVAGAGGAAGAGAGAEGEGGAPSYVALLHELCCEYGLGAPQYALVADTGPPHLRHFTMAARLARLERRATATTKKAARQHAAEHLYKYLRENLAAHTADFVEEEALARAHERAMARYVAARDEAPRRRLGQKICDYHLDEEGRAAALRSLEQADAVEGVVGALAALGLSAEARVLPAAGGALHVLSVPGAAPPLAFAARRPADAAADAARYLRRALLRPPAAPEDDLLGSPI